MKVEYRKYDDPRIRQMGKIIMIPESAEEAEKLWDFRTHVGRTGTDRQRFGIVFWRPRGLEGGVA